MSPPLKNLAENVKSLRKDQGVYQQDLAEKSKLSIAKIAICAVENPTLDTIASHGKALKLKDSLSLLS